MEEIISAEFNSELTGFNKDQNPQKKNKILIALSIFVVLTVSILLIVIIVLTLPQNNKSNDNANEPEEEDEYEEEDDEEDQDNPKIPYIGEINAIYEVQTNTRNTNLFGNEFSKESDFDIYIDGRFIKYTKEYKFCSLGKHILNIKLFNGLNMNYLVKKMN